MGKKYLEAVDVWIPGTSTGLALDFSSEAGLWIHGTLMVNSDRDLPRWTGKVNRRVRLYVVEDLTKLVDAFARDVRTMLKRHGLKPPKEE